MRTPTFAALSVVEILGVVIDRFVLSLIIVKGTCFFLDQLVRLLRVVVLIELALTPVVPTQGLLVERAV